MFDPKATKSEVGSQSPAEDLVGFETKTWWSFHNAFTQTVQLSKFNAYLMHNVMK